MNNKIIVALAFITIWVLGFKLIENTNIERYSIINGEYSPTILLDKKTGVTWRNINCDNKEKVPNCWQMMDMKEGFYPNLSFIEEFRYEYLYAQRNPEKLEK
jgi:hypothetical protein